MELNPGFDGKVTGSDHKNTGPPKIQSGVVTEFGFLIDNVTDISPVRALVGLKALRCDGMGEGKIALFSDLSPLRGMPLTKLYFGYTKVSNLSPLEGMPLTELSFAQTGVSDLSPLVGMPLTLLSCNDTKVSDLSPLSGMPLTTLYIGGTQVADLSPLAGMPVTNLSCDKTPIFDLSPLQGMNLAELRLTPMNITKGMDVIRRMASIKVFYTKNGESLSPAEFWKKYDAGDFGKPATKTLAYLDPAFQQWIADIQKLPAEQQIEAVSKKLMELNPGFDGKVTPKFRSNGSVYDFELLVDNIMDISAVRALVDLQNLACTGSIAGKGKLSDLSPLEGMRLTLLNCGRSQVADLSPLRAMKLTMIHCVNTPVSDLSPLVNCKSLTKLTVTKTNVTAAQVAELQKALPKCKIEWDDPAKATTPAPAPVGKK